MMEHAVTKMKLVSSSVSW